MIEISNLEAWTKEYFAKEENQEKSKKACERYDRLMVKQLRKQLMSGKEEININEIEDPGKCLEKAKYEVLPTVKCEGEKGKLRINLIDQTAEFIK